MFNKNLALQFQKEDKEILRTGTPVETIDNYEKSTNNIYFQRLKYPILDKRRRKTGIVGVSWDITSSRASGKILFKSPERMKSVFSQTADVVFIVGLFGNENYISPSVKNITGYTNEELLKKGLNEIIPKSSLPQVERHYREYLKIARKSGGIQSDPSKYLKAFEAEILHKTKGRIWVEVLTNLFSNENNEIVGIIGSVKDISIKKRMEQVNSENLVKEIKLNQLKSRFISTISHDLRTPLAVIKSNLELLKSKSYEIDNELQKDTFEMCFDAIGNISRNFEKIEIFKKTDNKLLDFQPGPLDIKQFFELLVKEINAIDKTERIDLQFNFPDKKVQMDRHLMFHIFSNLIHNALKYSGKNSKVLVKVSDIEGNLLEVIIKDDGIGIPKKELPLVFESFYRASNIGKVKGTGLGLSTVKNCVEIHNGTIRLNSILNKGTTIKIKLPYEHT